MKTKINNARIITSAVKLSLLASAATLAMLATTASAQSTTEVAADDNEETIIVTGSRPIAESEASALKIQRASDSLVSVVSADAVGRLPDQNIAQATGRLPGLAVERDQGQARYISVRGAPNNWTTISFDGITVVSPEGRDARFDSIPSAIASQIIVTKAVTPDLSGETISGNVNVITRSAFDYKGFRVNGKLGAGIVQLGNRREYEGALTVSDHFDSNIGQIGYLFSASYYERNMITDNYEIDWEPVSQDRRPGFAERYWARETENKLYRLTRKNYSVSGRVDFRPDEDNSLSMRSVFTIFTDDEARDNYIFDLDDRQGDQVVNTAACSTAVNPTPTTTGYADICTGNTPFAGTVYGIDINQRSTLRAFRQSVLTNTIEGKHNFAENWAFKWAANYTRSEDDRSTVGEARWESPSTRTLRPTVAYDFSNNNFARVQLFNTLQLAGPTRFQAGAPVTAIDTFAKPLTQFRALDAVDPTIAFTGKGEFSYKTSLFGGEGSIRLGFQYDQRTKENRERELNINLAQVTSLGLGSTYQGFSLDQAFLGKIPLGYTFRYFDLAQMRAYRDRAEQTFSFLPVSGNQYKVRENILAGYIMANSKFDWGSFVGGVRVERVSNTGQANATVPGVTGQLEASSSSTLLFPSLHVNYNLDSDKKLRIGFTSGAARADYDQLRPNVVVDDINGRISGGNPAAKPERAYGVDAYYEHYVVPQGYVMLGAFYKRVQDVLYTQRRTFGSDALNLGGIDRSGYAFSGINNGGSGRIFGFEAAVQAQIEPWTEQLGLPSWMGGFGFSANAVYNNSEVKKPAIFDVTGLITQVNERIVPLPGTSKVSYNIGAYYEKYGLSLRVQYQKRTAWADGFVDTTVDAGDTYWGADEEVDVSARFKVRKGFEIYFDTSNLLNQPGRRFSDPGSVASATVGGVPTASTEAYTIEWERFGRRFTGGIRFNF